MRKIFVAGHNGMVGSAICRNLRRDKNVTLITCERSDVDLLNYSKVEEFFRSVRPTEVIIAAAKVGGIAANANYPFDFIYQNLQIQNNIIGLSQRHSIQKLLFLGSSCIYPKYAQQPIKEKYLLSDALEPTNEPYAIAKIAGIKLCESANRQFGCDYRSVMPTNLYGRGDNYHPENSHVVPALLRRMHEAKENNLQTVNVWGSGNAYREFLFVDDLADACLFIHDLPKSKYQNITEIRRSFVNIGSGQEIVISELAKKIAKTVGFTGEIIFDRTKPDGTPRKLLDNQKLESLGWYPSIDLDQGLRLSYLDFLQSVK